MNARIFARAFLDIKRQAEQQEKQKKQKITLSNRSLESQLPVSKIIGEDIAKQKQKQIQRSSNPEPLLKRISKDQSNNATAYKKQWKANLYKALGLKSKKSRTILADGSSYADLMKIIKSIKLDIEEIVDGRIVMNSNESADRFIQLLRKQGLKARKQLDPQVYNTPAKEDSISPKSEIFKRIQ